MTSVRILLSARSLLLLACGLLFAALTTYFTELALANVDLLYFRAQSGPDSITLEWETASELDNLGFNLYRGETTVFGDATKLNQTLIPSQVGGQPIGAYYSWLDEDVVTNVLYTYWLEDVDFNGMSDLHEPVQASASGGNPIPTLPSPATNTPAPSSTPSRTPTQTPSPSPQVTDEPSETATTNPVQTSSPTPSATIPAGETPVPPEVTKSGTSATNTPLAPAGTSASPNTVTPAVQGINGQPTAEQSATVPPTVAGGEHEKEAPLSTSLSEGSGQESLALLNSTQLGAERQGPDQRADSTGAAQQAESAGRRVQLLILVVLAALLLLGGSGTIIVIVYRRHFQDEELSS